MKKFLTILALAATVCLAGCNDDTDGLWDEVNDLKSRVTALETQVVALNENIEALSQLMRNGATITDVKQTDGTYTLTFSGLCNSMMMFGGELKYTIRGGGYTHSDIYTETIAANALTSTFISKSFEGLELVEGETYEVEYELAVYPANMSSIGTNNTYSFSDKSIDLMTISKTVTLSI